MTPKNLALLFPDWNSLDSVRNAHSLLELWAIWLFAVLVVCDIVAHLVEDNRKPLAKIFERIGLCCFALAVAAELAAYKYGQRNDELSAGVIQSLSTEAGEAATKATKAITDSGTALGQSKEAESKSGDAVVKADKIAGKLSTLSDEADDLGIDLDGIQATISARRVADEKGLEDDLRNGFRGRHIVFKSYMGLGSDEPFWLCEQLLDIAKKADVDPVDKCASEPLRQIPVTNIQIDAPTIEEGQRLSNVLKKQRVEDGWVIGRVPGFSVTLRGGISELAVLVGVRPSVPMFPQLKMHGKAKARAAAKHKATL